MDIQSLEETELSIDELVLLAAFLMEKLQELRDKEVIEELWKDWA